MKTAGENWTLQFFRILIVALNAINLQEGFVIFKIVPCDHSIVSSYLFLGKRLKAEVYVLFSRHIENMTNMYYKYISRATTQVQIFGSFAM